MDSNFLRTYLPRHDGGGGGLQEYSVPGLARYRSAPPDFDFLCRPSSPDTDTILQRFMSATGDSLERAGDGEFAMPMKIEDEAGEGFMEQGRYSSPVSGDMAMEYMVAGGGMEATRVVPNKGGYVPSRLARHGSSPAGLFNGMSIEGRNVSMLNGTMSPIHETGKKNMFLVSSSAGGGYRGGLPLGALDGLMNPDDPRGGDDDADVFSGQIAAELEEEEKSRTRTLAHHLSLPKNKTSADITAIESFLQLQDSVPCKVRAKRGCATHPRSIAERVRRTKISERMRKLQELVPNMDKQTNTADMLDLAVDYIKQLQGQFKALSDNQARCTCPDTKFL